MIKRRKHYHRRYREPIYIDFEAIGNYACGIFGVIVFAYAIACPLLHTCGIEPAEWSWVYWLGQYIESVR